MKIAIGLTVLIVLMQFYDFWSTYFVLTHGGREMNPVLLRLQEFLLRLGFGWKWLWLMIAKTWAILVLGVGWYFNVWAGDGVYVLGALAAFYSYVMLGNYRAVKEVRNRSKGVGP